MPSKIELLTTRIEKLEQAKEMLKQIDPKDDKTKRSLRKMQRQQRIMEKEKNLREEYKKSTRRTPVENDERENRTAYLKRVKSARKKLREELRSKYRHLNPNKMSEEDSRRFNRMNEIIRDVRKRKRVLKTYKKLKKQDPKLYGKGETANPCLQKCPKDTLREQQLRKIRKELVKGMRIINRKKCKNGTTRHFLYDFNPGSDGFYKLPSSHWEADWEKDKPMILAKNESQNHNFHLKKNAKPSEAVNAIFSAKHPDCPIVIDCFTAIDIIYLRAILLTIGEKEFNRLFMSELNIGNPKTSSVRDYRKLDPVTNASDLKPGDWVYFYNHPDYWKMDRKPNEDVGAWRGENTIVTGNDKYEGFGVNEVSENEMQNAILDNYNSEAKNERYDLPPGLTKVERDEPKKNNDNLGEIHRFTPDVSKFSKNNLLPPDF